MTARRKIALTGAALSVVGVVLADRLEAASFLAALAAGILLGTAAAFTAFRQSSETFAAPAVAFILWVVPVLSVLFLWLLVAFEPPLD